MGLANPDVVPPNVPMARTPTAMKAEPRITPSSWLRVYTPEFNADAIVATIRVFLALGCRDTLMLRHLTNLAFSAVIIVIAGGSRIASRKKKECQQK
jgi:hypothetical protein